MYILVYHVIILYIHPGIGAPTSNPFAINGLLIGVTTGVFGVTIILITATFITFTVIMIRSKRALRVDLEFLKTKLNEQPIYEELAHDSIKSSSPPIDTGENTAYVSAFVISATRNSK